MKVSTELQGKPVKEWTAEQRAELLKAVGWELKPMITLTLKEDYCWDDASAVFAVPMEDFKSFEVGSLRWIEAENEDEGQMSFAENDWFDLFDWVGLLDEEGKITKEVFAERTWDVQFEA